MSNKRPAEVELAGNTIKQQTLQAPSANVGGVVKNPTTHTSRRPTIVYRPGQTLDSLVEHLTSGPGGNAQKVEVRAPGQFVCSGNHKVRGRQLWGCDVYTSDSDLVAVLMHCGYLHHTIPTPLRDVAEVRAVVVPMVAQERYQSVPRNSIRSRSWNSKIQGCSFRVDKAWVVTRTGNSYDLSPLEDTNEGKEVNHCGYSQVVPTFTPGKQERMMTRNIGHGGRSKASQEVAVMFSLSNDPWMKYSLQAVCDHGLKPHDRTSARLKSSVLLLETYGTRYELARQDGEGKGEEDLYVLSRCKEILSCKEYKAAGVPLPKGMKEVVEEGLRWEEIKFSNTGLAVRGVRLPIVRIQFVSDGHGTEA